ncbi:TfdA family taurine catabolism dioxygenase TauD [Chitinophaga skermanii]|uniref:TfdA family taurine catabolism dioxygenase TauD n=1 Tax=Chitinophaga skermanii TaxID=331697 RepID=A0A327R4K1_9BACT|nr:TauD/TfdA family dioxygenase [Chitinophaga skermanii]RAJ11145.1 TfdA family taurine catabolism dioxygenase TauD [Chitinophaga skermanii]
MNPVFEQGFPLVVRFNGDNRDTFIAWYKENEAKLTDLLHEKGAILFKGIDLSDLDDFEHVMSFISDKFVNYVDGFSPRTKLAKNIYTSTEYDADFYITLHNELSFSNRWPSRLFFFCVTPAQHGGETPIADGREILRKMRPELLETFTQKGVTYIRNLHNGGGVGPSWQQTYETESQNEVENFCKEGNVDFEWKEDGGLKIIQRKDALLKHPVSGEEVWFNQVDQFHPCHLRPEIYETLMELYDNQEEELPMYGCFGDDSRIEKEMIHEVRSIVDETAVPVAWQKGDLLMLDNVLVAHGRMPYKGDRKILVSMSV